jgi:hypothetical protein
MSTRKPDVKPVPHSWDFAHWPEHVYPHTESRARYLVRAFGQELEAARALRRIGREIVFDGARYVRWMDGKADRVPYFENGAAKSAAMTTRCPPRTQ